MGQAAIGFAFDHVFDFQAAEIVFHDKTRAAAGNDFGGVFGVFQAASVLPGGVGSAWEVRVVAGCPGARAEGEGGGNQQDWFYVFTVAHFWFLMTRG